MKDIIFSILTGFGCGIVFAAFKLPVPAPPRICWSCWYNRIMAWL